MYVKAYKVAGKAWLDTVVEEEEQAYITLYDKLQQLGDPHIDNFDQANREQVFNCIRDRTGRFLSEDEFVVYVEREEEKKKPKYKLTGDAKEALRDYYNTVHTSCEAQTNFARSTQVLEEKIEDKSVFLDIIQQVQLPAVQVQVRMVEELEKLEGKTYRELTLLCHLPNFRRIYHNATGQTRTMAAYIYFVLYEQVTGLRPSQTGCAVGFRCGTIPFKRGLKEATRWARQVKRGERRIQQAARRSSQNGRSHPRQAEKESDEDASSGKTYTQRQRQKRPRKK